VLRSFAGDARYRDSGIGFGLNLVQEVARGMGNPIEGLRRGLGGHRRRPAASDSERASAREKRGERV
jgi:hypothetical protein